MKRPLTFFGPVLLALATTVAASTQGDTIDSDSSTLVATFRQEGVSVEAPFTRFSGQINYVPEDVTTSTASLTVDTTSFDLGDPMYNAEVQKKGWFDSDNHPQASFTANRIETTGNNSFNATGELTLKGVTDTVTVPITVSHAQNGYAFAGDFEISRRTYGIGDPIWDDVLEDTVKVRFNFVTQNP